MIQFTSDNDEMACGRAASSGCSDVQLVERNNFLSCKGTAGVRHTGQLRFTSRADLMQLREKVNNDIG